jgi:hypothetical protein
MYGALEEELAYAPDFVPGKAGTDVMVVGHAHRPPGVAPLARDFTRLDVRLSLDNWSRHITAVAGGAAERLPLSGAYARSVDGVTVVRPLGPIARPAPSIYVGEKLDVRHFNAAPPEQRLLRVAPDVEIGLEGLSPSAPRVTLPLPALAPRAFVEARFGPRNEVPLRRDTIWIDADARKIVLVWRGAVAVPSLDKPAIERFVISLEDARSPRSISEILRQLPRGAFSYAVEPADLAEDAPPIPRRDATLEAARYRTWRHPEPPDPILPQAEYTALSAALAAKGAPRELLLARAGLDEYGLLVEQRAWAGRTVEVHAPGDRLPAEERKRLAQEASRKGGEAVPPAHDEEAR